MFMFFMAKMRLLSLWMAKFLTASCLFANIEFYLVGLLFTKMNCTPLGTRQFAESLLKKFRH